MHDQTTKLTWEQSDSASAYDWEGAKTRCATLGLAGGGWRLPSVKELQTIVDGMRRYPAVEADAFPKTQFGPYWSASPLAGNAQQAWSVGFDIGMPLPDAIQAGYVRCVR